MMQQKFSSFFKTWRSVLALCLVVIVMSGCASRLPEELRTDEKQLIEFSDAFIEPQAHTGSPARWGGLIANVENLSESSVIEVVQFDLSGYGRPHVTEESPGRFRIRVPGFIDPEIYKQGREVSVFGLFSGVESGFIGEFEYMFPMIESEGLHLWPERAERQRVDVMLYHPYPAYRFRFWGPHYPYFPSVSEGNRRRVPQGQSPQRPRQQSGGNEREQMIPSSRQF